MFTILFKSKKDQRSRCLWPKPRQLLLMMLLLAIGVFSFGNEALTFPVYAQSSTPLIHTQSDYGNCTTGFGRGGVTYQYITRNDCVWQAYYDGTGFWRYGYWSGYNYNYYINFKVDSSSGQVYRQSGYQWIYWYDLF